MMMEDWKDSHILHSSMFFLISCILCKYFEISCLYHLTSNVTGNGLHKLMAAFIFNCLFSIAAFLSNLVYILRNEKAVDCVGPLLPPVVVVVIVLVIVP